MRETTVPFFRPRIGPEEEAAVLDVLRSGWLTSGSVVRRFEESFAAAVGAAHAVAVNSCTAALHLALRAWGVGPGDEVLVPALTFVSAAEVVLHVGARPVLIDVRPDDLTIDVEAAGAAVSKHTAAIMPMHYGGQPCDMEAVRALAGRYGIAVIEDAAHAFPAAYRERPVGSLSEATCFSFYANKTMTTGEGGMVTTDDGDRAELVRSLSLHGMSRGAWTRFDRRGSWDYDVARLGHKYNLPDTSAALGTVQLRRAERMRADRARAAAAYDQRLAEAPGLRRLVTHAERHSAHHLYVVEVERDRDALVDELRHHGITCSVHYRPLHRQGFMRGHLPERCDHLATATRMGEHVLSLPLFPDITEAQIDLVSATLQASLHRRAA